MSKKEKENSATGDLITRSIAWTKDHRVRVGKTAKDHKKRVRHTSDSK